MSFQDLSWNISRSRLVILAASVLEISCGKQTDRRQSGWSTVASHWTSDAGPHIVTRQWCKASIVIGDSACIDPEFKRSRSHGYDNCHGRTVASDHVPYSAHPYAAMLPAAVAGVGLHVDTTAYVL